MYNLKLKVEAFAVEEKVSESRLRKVEEVGLYLGDRHYSRDEGTE